MAKPLVPEVLSNDPPPAGVESLVKLARLLDEAVQIPGTNRRVGLDALLGLVPGLGDVVSAVLSLAIVHGALRYRVPGRKIGRMLWNVILDASVGTIPILGDVFDVFYTANKSNAEILLRYRDTKQAPRSGGEVAGVIGLFALITLAVLVAALIGVASAIAWAVQQIAG